MTLIDGKRCTKCDRHQPWDAFYVRAAKRDGRHSWCRTCVIDAQTARYRINHPPPDPPTERPCFRCKRVLPVELFSSRAWQCRTCAATHMRNLRASDPLYTVRVSLWDKYRLTIERYDEMLAGQGGGCAICGRPPRNGRHHVDHDHACCPGKRTCGKCIRGLVCFTCNIRIGLIESNSERAQRIRAYLGVRVVRDDDASPGATLGR